ncbi:MAG: hypothetical protein HC910_10560 [Spirulinaceae cyanobacterium SM2_1_0]|nr:hypothetical protein [Spirulinaceae cyanobacterium SM2_1_0]
MLVRLWFASLAALGLSLGLVACQPASEETAPAENSTIDKARDAADTIEQDQPPNPEAPESEEAEE